MAEVPVTDESGEVVESPDLTTGYIEDSWEGDGSSEPVLVARVWHEYVPGQAEEAAEERAAAMRSAQVATFAALAMPALAPTIPDSRAAEVSALAPAYVAEGHEYKAGEVFRTEGGGLWRVSQDFTSQDQWAPGGEGLDALFYRIELAPDGVIVWAQPHGSYDAVCMGDLRHYPDADGPVYMSLVEGNAYSPDANPSGWEQVEQ